MSKINVSLILLLVICLSCDKNNKYEGVNLCQLIIKMNQSNMFKNFTEANWIKKHGLKKFSVKRINFFLFN